VATVSTLVIAGLAAGAGLGAALLLAGALGRPTLELGTGGWVRRITTTTGPALLGASAVAALVTLALTGWPAGAAIAALAVLFGPRLLGGRAARDASVARTESIAAWTEMIRDSISAASGLEEAIVATGPVAPRPIRREVNQLVRRVEHASLPDALRAFGEEVAHPSADLVVAALTIAARMEASDLTGLLSRLADSIRGEARMRVRVEVGRTRVRTATKVIVGVVGATVALLTLLNREYLRAYDTAGGQVVLIFVAGIFATGGWLLVRMAELDIPDRFTARPARPTAEAAR
jgi:tight adherence protein B